MSPTLVAYYCGIKRDGLSQGIREQMAKNLVQFLCASAMRILENNRFDCRNPFPHIQSTRQAFKDTIMMLAVDEVAERSVHGKAGHILKRI